MKKKRINLTILVMAFVVMLILFKNETSMENLKTLAETIQKTEYNQNNSQPPPEIFSYAWNKIPTDKAELKKWILNNPDEAVTFIDMVNKSRHKTKKQCFFKKCKIFIINIIRAVITLMKKLFRSHLK